ncbi:MAG: hypothetical protein ACOX4U_00625 [Anaerovoracaceae bacterium]|jgi:hypothetical protein
MLFKKAREITRLQKENMRHISELERYDKQIKQSYGLHNITKTTLYADSVPGPTTVIFSLPHHDWCKFEDSSEWKAVEEFLLALQKEHNR